MPKRGHQPKFCIRCLNEGVRNSKTKKCWYCGDYFCKRHLKSESNTRRDENGNIITLGHRCLPYEEYGRKKEKIIDAKAWNSMNEMRQKEYENRNERVRQENRFEPRKPKFELPRFHVRARLTNTVKILYLFEFLLFLEYFVIKQYFFETLYLFETFILILLVFKIFKKASRIQVRSDLSLFGLKILSGIVSIIGFLILYFGFMGYVFSSIFIGDLNSPIVVIFTIPFFILGFSLLILGAYLFFRFQLRSGIIVYPR